MLIGALDGRWPTLIRTLNTHMGEHAPMSCGYLYRQSKMRRRVLIAVTGATGSAASMLSTDREPFGVDRLLDGYQR
jgi:hypothetical protein